MSEQQKQLKTLLRVKQLKEEQAFRNVNIKRQEVDKALRKSEAAQEEVKKSENTLETRQDAVYEQIIGDIVPLDELEIRKGMVLNILKDHENLEDEKERAVHVHAKTEEELVTARHYHIKTIRDKDKYITITDEIKKEDEAKQTLKEEDEAEDQFISKFLTVRKEAS